MGFRQLLLKELAANIGAEAVFCPEDASAAGLASLLSAKSTDLSLVVSEKYLEQARTSSAGAFISAPGLCNGLGKPTLEHSNPYLAFARATSYFSPKSPVAGISDNACIDASAHIGKEVHIGDFVRIGANARIGDRAVIGSGCDIGACVSIGEGTRLYQNLVLYPDVVIGKNCILHGGSVIGADGFGFAPSADGWVKIYQLGAVRIGDNCEIGPNCTISRGALDDTLIGNGVIIDAQVLVAHNVEIGERTAIAGQVGFAGSSKIGDNCTFGGQVAVTGHIEISDNVHVTGKSAVTKSIRQSGRYSSTMPAMKDTDWQRTVARLRTLDRLVKKLSKPGND